MDLFPKILLMEKNLIGSHSIYVVMWEKLNQPMLKEMMICPNKKWLTQRDFLKMPKEQLLDKRQVTLIKLALDKNKNNPRNTVAALNVLEE